MREKEREERRERDRIQRQKRREKCSSLEVRYLRQIGEGKTLIFIPSKCVILLARLALSFSLTLSLFPSFSLSLPPCLWGASEREPQAQRLLNAHTPEGGINSLADIHRECLPPRLSLSPFLPPFRSLPLHQPSSRLFSFLPPRC